MRAGPARHAIRLGLEVHRRQRARAAVEDRRRLRCDLVGALFAAGDVVPLGRAVLHHALHSGGCVLHRTEHPAVRLRRRLRSRLEVGVERPRCQRRRVRPHDEPVTESKASPICGRCRQGHQLETKSAAIGMMASGRWVMRVSLRGIIRLTTWSGGRLPPAAAAMRSGTSEPPRVPGRFWDCTRLGSAVTLEEPGGGPQ